ncbi:LysR family transcriptional regulator [Salinisphaera orenii]|uniref:LysR family transcriptional regulator n=1 Tax=Salinisphaera orenii YIM 95161 TaxID=1051139 RepID=A0A423PRH9_9GAMM|nr:LysR family transcriptional regulator [Salinisphaera halophila]ROO28219.1 LysR family transcriptional regulator [Salinisphaera halophila YIM 95161]
MQDSLGWEELRLTLAIVRSGSLAGAARALDVSHATIFRRLESLEKRIGVRLFERARGGYTPTPAGEDMAAAGARMEQEVLGVERRVVGRDLRPSGTVRLTTTDTLFEGLVAPMLGRCRAEYPQIALEVAISNETFNLSRRDADMAIRPIAEPPEALIAYRLARVALAVYRARDADENAASQWIGLDDSVSFPALNAWMQAQGAHARCDYRLDTMQAMQSALRHSDARAVLPCYLGDADPTLVRIGAPIAALATDLWLLIHPDLRRVARMRAVRDLLIDGFARGDVVQQLAGTAQADRMST